MQKRCEIINLGNLINYFIIKILYENTLKFIVN